MAKQKQAGDVADLLSQKSTTPKSAKAKEKELLEEFPSLKVELRPVMVSKSYRIPLTMAEQLTKVCLEHNLRDESKLVRDFIAAGLDALESTRKLSQVKSEKTGPSLDSIDLELVEELQVNGRTSFAELARRVHLSTPAVIDRVHRLEDTGIILRYRAEIDPAALGLLVRAFVKVTVAGDRLGNFSRVVREIPEILECHRVTGNESYIVQVAVRDMNHLEAVIDSMMPYVSTNTSMVLNSPVQGGRVAPHTGLRPTLPKATR